MFQPLSMGTNHMFGVDNYVPLTSNNFEIRIYNMDGTNPTENADLLTLSTAEIGEISEEQHFAGRVKSLSFFNTGLPHTGHGR